MQPNYAFKRTAGRGFDVSCNAIGPLPLNAALVEWGLFVEGPHVLRSHAESPRWRQALVVHLISSLSTSAQISRARSPATCFIAPAPLRGAA